VQQPNHHCNHDRDNDQSEQEFTKLRASHGIFSSLKINTLH
jgi:hypothetical protein